MNSWNNGYQFELEVMNLENYQIYDWKWEIFNEQTQVIRCWLTIEDEEPYAKEVQSYLEELGSSEGTPLNYDPTKYGLNLVLKGALFDHELAYAREGLLMWTKYPTMELVEKARQVVFEMMSEEELAQLS